MTKIRICLDDPETRAIWDTVLEARREVASWPAWKRGDDQPTTGSKDMGMANKAPEARYVRKYNISTHALERFRERVEEDMKCRSNFDIGNALDEKVKQSRQHHTVRDPRAPEEVTKLHEIEVRSGTYYAVVRNDTVVTVLDETMVKTNFEMANWKPTMNAPFTRESLQAVQPATLPRKPAPVTPVATAPPAPVQSLLEAAGAAYAVALRAKRDAKVAHEQAREALVAADEACLRCNANAEQARLTLEALAAGDD
jgi:hypothetical protein